MQHIVSLCFLRAKTTKSIRFWGFSPIFLGRPTLSLSTEFLIARQDLADMVVDHLYLMGEELWSISGTKRCRSDYLWEAVLRMTFPPKDFSLLINLDPSNQFLSNFETDSQKFFQRTFLREAREAGQMAPFPNRLEFGQGVVDRPTQLICISDIYLYVNRQIQKT